LLASAAVISERTDFPIATGSVATENTMGMVVVAALPRVPTRRQVHRSPPPERQPARPRQEAIFAIRRFAVDADCCARAIGRAIAAPPRSVMNSRGFMPNKGTSSPVIWHRRQATTDGRFTAAKAHWLPARRTTVRVARPESLPF